MRMRIKVSGAYRELQDDLQALPERERGQRICYLAALGLSALKGGIAPVSAEPERATAPAPPASPEDPEQSERRGLMSQVGSSFTAWPDE